MNAFSGNRIVNTGTHGIRVARAPRKRLRIRWFMVTGYITAAALSWFASRAYWAEQWVAFAVLFIAVTMLGYLLSTGRKR